ncbi:hypothetical protein AN901_202428 [Pseudomonas syringae pv. theae]|nr:hypothetical protein AN901_202428 [Pseudomonas syringae pv. theae]
MWFLHLMDPNSAAYNIFSIAKLHGYVNLDALRQAFRALIHKHLSLRTSFQANENGQPESVVHGAVDADVFVIDNPESPEQCLDNFIWQPFDLGRAPLFKAVVIRTDDETCLMALVIHHIVADGWSLGILHEDLQSFYAAALALQSLPTTSNIDFSTFVAAEKAWIASEAGIRSRKFWKRQLHDLTQIELPMAKPRPAIANFRGKHIDLALPQGLVQSLEALAKHIIADAELTHLPTWRCPISIYPKVRSANALRSRSLGQQNFGSRVNSASAATSGASWSRSFCFHGCIYRWRIDPAEKATLAC